MRGLTYAVRRLLRTPVATFVIVLTLALGIGAPTTLASVVRGVLLRPLAFADQERLVTLWQEAPGVGVAEDWFSPAQYFDLRERVGHRADVALEARQTHQQQLPLDLQWR